MRIGSITLTLFIVSLMTPILFWVGSVLLSPYRIILIAAFIPCVIAWLSGRVGGIQSTDVLVLFTALWGALAFAVVNGAEVFIQTGGIFILETFGSYLLARCLIRDRSRFERMVRVLFFSVVFVLPFALIENFTGRGLIHLLGNYFTTELIATPGTKLIATPGIEELRWGLHRAKGNFEHPIAFGVVCATVFGLATYVMGKWSRSALVALGTVTSLSAAAFISLASQVLLMIWDRRTRGLPYRWGILGLLFACGLFVIELLSHRSTFELAASYLTFNGDYMRILIWRFGSAEVFRHPIFGIGLNDWSRPWWLHSGSVDNFWLVIAMRSGVMGFVLIAAAFLSVFVRLSRLRNLSDNVKSCRAGLLIALTGLVVALCTVDVWRQAYCLIMFLLGSGLWMVGETAPKFTRTSTIRQLGMPITDSDMERRRISAETASN